MTRSYGTSALLVLAAAVLVVIGILWQTGNVLNDHPRRALVAFVLAAVCLIGAFLTRPRRVV